VAAVPTLEERAAVQQQARSPPRRQSRQTTLTFPDASGCGSERTLRGAAVRFNGTYNDHREEIVTSTRVLAIAFLLTALFPAAAAEPVTKLRFESAFPVSSLLFENSKYFVERVKAMTDGKLQIEILPPGAVVPPFEVLDAVHKGVLDGAHSGPAYWIGKNRAAALFGPSPGGPFGMDLLDYLGWIYEAGGFELYQELYQKELQRNIGPCP
jgi:TRAP-type mannitol/chloroaromatic compound transport system substrate-binding protein